MILFHQAWNSGSNYPFCPGNLDSQNHSSEFLRLTFSVNGHRSYKVQSRREKAERVSCQWKSTFFELLICRLPCHWTSKFRSQTLGTIALIMPKQKCFWSCSWFSQNFVWCCLKNRRIQDKSSFILFGKKVSLWCCIQVTIQGSPPNWIFNQTHN